MEYHLEQGRPQALIQWALAREEHPSVGLGVEKEQLAQEIFLSEAEPLGDQVTFLSEQEVHFSS